MSNATPTTKVKVTLTANYGSQQVAVIAKRWPNGDCWITARQLAAATKRAGVCEGDYLAHMGGDEREGYLVKQA